MVQVDYRINQNLPDSVKQEIAAQPNLINVESNGTSSLYSFDHTPAQAIVFKKFLLTKLGLNDDALSKYTTFNGATTIYTSDVPVVLTNVGTAFKNLHTRSDGMSFGFDTDVYENIRLHVHWTRGAGDTGVHTLQVVQKGVPSNVLASLSNLVTGSNLGSVTAIPDAMRDTKNLYLIQVKSTVAGDDPTYEGCRVYIQ